MRLPSKVTPYTQSVLTLFPKILKELRDGPLPAAVLSERLSTIALILRTSSMRWIVSMRSGRLIWERMD